VRETIHNIASDSAPYPVAHSELVVDKSDELEPEFVLAADGPQSVVRQQLGIVLSELRPSERYLVVEGRTASPSSDTAVLSFDAGAGSAMWPLPDGRQHAIYITNATDAEMLGLPEAGAAASASAQPGGHARIDAERLSAWVALRTPWLGAALTELEARGPFHAHHRLASSFGRGRIWLAGAAAHSGSPLSSLSTNVGLSEAAELSEILAGAGRGAAPLDALAAYDVGHRERWQRLLEPPPDALQATPTTPRAPVSERRPSSGAAAPAPGFDVLLARLTSDPWSSLLQFGTTSAG
jgi:2-polyprenyl-6-methoxyphenol hydroxylase-like FAD-dependent oxidoreductase